MGNLCGKKAIETKISGILIHSVDDTKMIYLEQKSETKYCVKILNFQKDISTYCVDALDEIRDTKKEVILYHDKSQLYALKGDHFYYMSNKISPTTFGWVINK